MSIGEKIQQFRKAGGLSQEQLADSLNVSRQAVSKWETDQSSPDIENILAISKFFSITTDELLGNGNTNSPPDSTHLLAETKKRIFSDVRRIGRLLFGSIDGKILLIIFSLLCFIAAGTCAIVNFAINRQITWAAYPLISIALGWVVAAPLFFKKLIASLCALTATVPYLYCMDKLTPGPDWFGKLGLPIALVGIVFSWAAYLLFRFAKINAWYKTAIVLLAAGVVVNPAIDYIVGETSALNLSISIFSGLFMSAIFCIIGYIRNKAKSGAK